MRCSLSQCYTLASVGTVPTKSVHIGSVVLPHLASESGANNVRRTKFVNRVSCLAVNGNTMFSGTHTLFLSQMTIIFNLF